MMQSDYTSWSVAVLMSLLIHSMMFMNEGAQMGVESTATLTTPLITRLSFTQSVVKPVLDEPHPVEKRPTRPVKKIEPGPVIEKQLIQQRESVVEAETVRQHASQPQTQGQQVAQSSESLLHHKRQQYLHKLLSHIESFKFYPRAARRRSIEGGVKISFILHDDGSYDQLKLDGGRTILVQATRQALESAVPLPEPPKDIALSSQVEFTMVYSITN